MHKPDPEIPERPLSRRERRARKRGQVPPTQPRHRGDAPAPIQRPPRGPVDPGRRFSRSSRHRGNGGHPKQKA